MARSLIGQHVQGTIAAGTDIDEVANTGWPLLMGAMDVVTGSGVTLQKVTLNGAYGLNGSLKGTSGAALADATANGGPFLPDAANLPSQPLYWPSFPFVFNGATWDRQRAANGLAGTAGTGLPGCGTMLWDNTNSLWRRALTDALGRFTVITSVTGIGDISTGGSNLFQDAGSNNRALGVLDYVFNGTGSDRLRTPFTFKNVATVAVGAETTVWTPGAGKKFRLMGAVVGGSAACTVTIRDNTAGTVIQSLLIQAGATVVYSWGNGILSAAANNLLTVQSSVACNMVGVFYGTEE